LVLYFLYISNGEGSIATLPTFSFYKNRLTKDYEVGDKSTINIQIKNGERPRPFKLLKGKIRKRYALRV
jgi:hypothetical protein